MNIVQHLNELYSGLNAFSKTNPIVAGAVSLWGLGVITFLVRGIPTKILDFLQRECTTTLVINNSDVIYFQFLEWITKNKMHSFIRNFNFNNSNVYGYGKATISIGYGKMYFFHKGRLFCMHRLKDNSNQTHYSKETITLILYGRNRSLFEAFFNYIKVEEKTEDNRIEVYTYRGIDAGWILQSKHNKRPVESVIIECDVKNKLFNHIDNFMKDKDFCLKNGIPWRTGILFTGPPGTGKTSLAKAVAGKYGNSLYVINASGISGSGLLDALSRTPAGGIVVMEDIDAAGVEVRDLTNSKEINKTSDQAPKSQPSAPIPFDPFSAAPLCGAERSAIAMASEWLSPRTLRVRSVCSWLKPELGIAEESVLCGTRWSREAMPPGWTASTSGQSMPLSEMLNAIDGILSGEGRILIATTNCPEKLDEALTREGRFDLKLEIGYMTNETVKSYLSRFFPDFKDFHKYDVLPRVAPCKIQKLLFDNRTDIFPILKEIAVLKQEDFYYSDRNEKDHSGSKLLN